jgi:hypothetical protein
MIIGMAVLLVWPEPLFAQIDEGNFVFTGKRLRVFFQPRIRASTDEKLAPKAEIGRLNYTVNFFDNYLEYLVKIQKVASSTLVSLDYNPEGGDEAFSQRVTIRSLGFNKVLSVLNAHLAHQPGTSRSRLVDEKEAVLSMGDHLVRNPATVEETMNFLNQSELRKSLAPEHDFAVVDAKNTVTIRPLETGNEIILFREASGVLLLPRDEAGEYNHLAPSPDGKYLAYTLGDHPHVIALGNKQVLPVFPGDSQKKLLDMEWSPRLNRLCGMVIDTTTLSREIFLFDVEAQKRNRWVDTERTISGDYQFAYPVWSDDGKRVLFCSGDEIHLLDLVAEKAFPRLASSRGGISEILWAPDNQSFVFTEVLGQARSSSEFDDRDFSGSTLRRIRLKPDGGAEEDPAGRIVSSQTIKLVSFWSQDRVLFLEGNLKNQRVFSCLWDLKKVFTAQLTSSGTNPKVGPTDIPLAYCFAFKTLDGKFKNLYDSGFGHQNYLFLDRLRTIWLIGLRGQDSEPSVVRTFCLRPAPFPFPERNEVILSSFDEDEAASILGFFRSYDIRRFEILPAAKRTIFLSSSPGPMTLWSGPLTNLFRQKLPMPLFGDSPSPATVGLPGLPDLPGSPSGSSLPPPLQLASPTSGAVSPPVHAMPDLPF